MRGCGKWYYPVSCFSSGSFQPCSKHPNKKHFTRSEMTGLFFCLASAEGAGFLFCPATIHPIQTFTAHSVPLMQLYHPHGKTAHRALHVLFLLFAVFCRCCCMAVHPAMPHYLRHAGAYHSASAPPEHTRYQRYARTLYRPAQQPYYNNVYKSVAYRRPCKPGGFCSCRVWIAGKC